MKELNTNENTYVKRLSYNAESPLDRMRSYALLHKVPIIGDEALRFLELMAALKNPAEILEVGTAIGYSTAAFLLHSRAKIVSIERNEEHYLLAERNLRELGLIDRAKLILGDASECLLKLAKEGGHRFDFVFIDASKAHYLEHLKLAEPMIKKGALIIFDNILYLGLLAGRRTVSKNNTIRRRMEELIDYTFSSTNYKASLIQAEDGMLLLRKLGDED